MEKIISVTWCDECPFFYDGFMCQYYSKRVLYDRSSDKPEWCKVKRVIVEEE